nr:ABC-three component system middle component 6 [Methylorubrum extorquens]
MRHDRALIGVGADVLAVLDGPRTVSATWEAVRAARARRPDASPLSFDWFVLALCFLNAVSAIELVEGGLIAPCGGRR